MYFSIDSWARRFRSWFPDKPVLHLPVGSDMPHISIQREEVRSRLKIGPQTIVLGLFGTAHVARLLQWVRHAAEAVQSIGPEVLVLYVGPDGKSVCQVLDKIPAIAEGSVSPEEVSRRFAAMDICLMPMIDGISTWRTSMMTGLQHSVVTIWTWGVNTDAMLRQEDNHTFLLSEATELNGFVDHVLCLARDAALREKIGGGGQSLYEREFAWERVASRLLIAMQKSGASMRQECET